MLMVDLHADRERNPHAPPAGAAEGRYKTIDSLPEGWSP